MPTQWESLANEHILGIAPYEPGKPIEELERELMIHNPIKLASNENPLPPSDRVQKAIIAALSSLDRYPDGSGFYLRQALAKKHGVMPDQVVLGNGSNELIELLVRTFLRPGDEAVVPHPSFVVYPMIVQAAGGVRVMVMLKDFRRDLEAMARAITPMTNLVSVATPNNPTATIVTKDEVEHFMVRVPERTIVVFDEAYVEFAMGRDFPDMIAAVKQGRKVVVLRTFSKATSLAGLRVGYGVADADAIALMNRIRQPFNVNSLAQAAALAALDDDAHVLECVRMIEAGRHVLYDEFQRPRRSYLPSRVGSSGSGATRLGSSRPWTTAHSTRSRPISTRACGRPTSSCSRPRSWRSRGCSSACGARRPTARSSPMWAPRRATSCGRPSVWRPAVPSRSSAAIRWPAPSRAAIGSRVSISSAAPRSS